MAKRYSKSPVADEVSYQKKLAITQRHLHADMTVLEIGCGTGSTAIAHAPHVKHIRAVDISEKMIDICREKATTGAVDNVSFDCAAIDALDVDTESVDAVLALSLLHLVADRDVVIEDIHRMLKPGGVFISSTACLGGRMGWLKLIAPLGYFLGLFPMLRIFKVSQMVDSVLAAGFEIDFQWQPEASPTVFIVAKKAAD